MAKVYHAANIGGSESGGIIHAAYGDSPTMDDESSLLWSALKFPLTALGYGLRALDLPRRALWTLAEQGGARIGSALGVREDPVPHWSTTWEDMESGKGVIGLYAPDWVKENENAAWWYGLPIEIAGDPINLISGPGAMTKLGRGLKMGTSQGLKVAADAGSPGALRALEIIGKRATTIAETERLAAKYSRMLLGATWATQSAHGQRALVSILGSPLIKGEGAVRALGGVGKALGAMTQWTGENVFHTDFFSRTLDPHLRRIQDVARDKAAHVHTKLLRIQDDMGTVLRGGIDEIAGVTGQKHADIMEQVARTAEHYSRPGWHADEFAKAAPEIQDLARKYQLYQDEFWQVATKETGIERPSMQKKFETLLNDLKDARGEHLEEMAQRIAAFRNEELGIWRPTTGRGGDPFEKAVYALNKATRNAERYAHELNAFQNTQSFLKHTGGKQASANAELVMDLQQALSKQADAAFRVQTTFAMDMLRGRVPEIAKGERAKLVKLTEQMNLLSKAQDDLPAYVMKNLTPEGMAAVRKWASGAGGSAKLWTDQFQGEIERTIAEYMNIGGKELKRALSFDEAAKVFQKALGKVGKTKLQSYAEATLPVMDQIKRYFGKGEGVARLSKFYDMDIVKGFEKMGTQVVHAYESTEFVKMLSSSPEMVSKVAKDGWIHIKDVSDFAHKALGDAWVSPQLHRELRRTYTRAFQPEALNAAVRSFDKITRFFKTSVTVPESFSKYIGGAVAGGVVGGLVGGDLKSALIGSAVGMGAAGALKNSWIPAFPAYHFRNNMSDFVLMGYNGKFNPAAVLEDGFRAASGKGLIDCGKALGMLPAEEVHRMARAYGITWGEVQAFAQSRIGTFAEDARRMGYFVDRLKTGFSPFQAAMETKRVLFDYGQLSDFERGLMRRVIPFWSWQRNIVKLSVEQLMSNPAIIKHQLRLAAPSVSRSDVPSWIKGRMPIALAPDKQTGEERFLTGIGLPVEDLADLLDGTGGFNDWVKQWAFKINPSLKAMMGFPALSSEEAGAGFWDRLIGLKDYPSTFGKLGEYVPEALHDKFGIRKVEDRKTGAEYYTVDPHWEFVFSTIANRFFRTAVKYSDPRRDDGERMVDFLTGARIDSFDTQRTKDRERRRREDALLAKSRRRGDVWIKEIPIKRR